VFDSGGLVCEWRELIAGRHGRNNELGVRRAAEFRQRARLTGDATGARNPSRLMMGNIIPVAPVGAKERTIQRERRHRQGEGECEHSPHLCQYMPHE
jgi:hypothetical protein